MNGAVYVQLGWLQSAINYVYEHILSPAFEKIFSILGEIQRFLFEKLLLPIIEAAFSVQIELFKTLFMNFLYNALFRLTRVVMWVLDAVENAFRTFAGLNPVYIQNDRGELEEGQSLLYALVSGHTFRTALFGMIAASFALCFLVAIFATIRSIGDFGGEDGKSQSVGKVLRLTGSAMLRLVLIPLMALFFVLLGDAILKSVYIATNSDQAAISDIIFTMSTLDAVREDVPDGDAEYYNSSTRVAALAKKGAKSAASVSDFGLKDKYRKDYYLGMPVEGITGDIEGALGVGRTKKRTVMFEVLETFDIRRIDYFIAIGMTILFIYIFGSTAVSMIARIFDCLLLLLVEPFFAATIPLDDGGKFKGWQELFLSRLVSGYGTVVAMNLYLSIITLIFEGKIAFFGEGTTPAVDYLVKLVFVLMGAYAMTQAGPLISGIMSYQGGQREGEMMTQGASLTAAAAGLVTAPFRKVAAHYWNKGVSAATDMARDAFKTGSILNGRSPVPGEGDAFGTPGGGKNGPEGVQFDGKKGAPGTGGGTGSGPTGVQFDGKKDGPHTAVLKTGDDDDGFATVFDVGGKSLFDEDDSGLPGDKESGQSFKGKDKQRSFTEPTGGLDTPDTGLPYPYGYLQGPGQQPPDTDGTYGFLNAGNAVDEKFNYIGERDKQEREEKKKLEEQLSAIIEEETLFAAESETGMDLNGDGFVTGSINDGFNEDLTMNDILGTGDPLADLKKDPLADLKEDPFKKQFETTADQLGNAVNDQMFREPQIDLDGLGGDNGFVNGSINDLDDEQLTMQDIVGGGDPLGDLARDPMEGLYEDPFKQPEDDPFKKQFEDGFVSGSINDEDDDPYDDGT